MRNEKNTSVGAGIFLTADNHLQQNNFSMMNWLQLVERCKTPKASNYKTGKIAKINSAIVGASDAPSKLKADVLAHDNMTLLRLDLDDVGFNIKTIEETLGSLSIFSYIIHTSASHQQGGNGNRYRVYIELAFSLSCEYWASVESYLNFGFKADDCAGRPQQIMYLPTHFEGIIFDYAIGYGEAFNPKEHQLTAEIDLYIKERNETQNKKSSYMCTSYTPKPQKTENLLTGQLSIIEAVNEDWDWDKVLLHYGYIRQGKAWLPPESKSKVAGAYILKSSVDNKDRYYSHHSDDPCRMDGHCLDIFDFILIREYKGNQFEMMLAMGNNYPEITTHNQEIYRKIKGGS